MILEKYVKSNFPTDSDGKLCGVDYPAYPYVYFAQAPEIVYNLNIIVSSSLCIKMPRKRR